jgi:spermidine synthase
VAKLVRWNTHEDIILSRIEPVKQSQIVIEQDNRSGDFTYWLARGPQSLAGRDGVSLAAYIHALYGFLRQARAEKILLIGCGGGTLATMLARSRAGAALRKSAATLTIVDIDPLSFELARRYFRLPKSIACHVADGAAFLRSQDTHYDAIVLDAYGEGGVPRHLMRGAFFELVKSRLVRGGIFLINMIGADDDDKRPDRVAWRLRRSFASVRICDAEGELDRNVLLLAGRVRNLKRPRLYMRPARGTGELVAELKRFDFRHLRA